MSNMFIGFIKTSNATGGKGSNQETSLNLLSTVLVACTLVATLVPLKNINKLPA